MPQIDQNDEQPKRQLKVASIDSHDSVEPSFSKEERACKQRCIDAKGTAATAPPGAVLAHSDVLNTMAQPASSLAARRFACTNRAPADAIARLTARPLAETSSAAAMARLAASSPSQSIARLNSSPGGQSRLETLAASPPCQPPQTKRSGSLEGFAKNGILAGQVQVQWLKAEGGKKGTMAAEKGSVSRKGLQLKLCEGRVVAVTRGFARDVELSSSTVVCVHEKFASEGKATFEVEEDLDGQPISCHVLLSKSRPEHLARLMLNLRK